MTTIAYDGVVLAGDSYCERGNWKGKVPGKVWLTKAADGREVLYGGAGDWSVVLAVKEWLEGGEKPAAVEQGTFSAVRVFRGGGPQVCTGGMRWDQWDFAPFVALGSGRDFAAAAMHCGKGAVEAVEIACHFDYGTYPPVTGVRFP